MSVDNLNIKKRSILLSKNAHPDSNLHPSPFYVKRPKAETWADFIPYKNELTDEFDSYTYKSELISNNKVPSPIHKSRKDALNKLAKLTKNHYYHPMSVFHIHTLHLHLFISLTLLLVTHKCPQYLIVI